MVFDGVSETDWLAVIARAKSDAISGSPNECWRAREWLSTWLLGGKPREPIEIDVEHTQHVIVWPTGWEPSLPDAAAPLIEGEARNRS